MTREGASAYPRHIARTWEPIWGPMRGRVCDGRLVCPFHGYDNVSRVAPVSVDGPCLESCFDFKRVWTIARIASFTFDISAAARVYGLGYSFVEIREHSIGMDLRLWVLATPVDGTLIDLSLVAQVREIRNSGRWIAGLGFLPVRLRTPIMNRIIVSQQ